MFLASPQTLLISTGDQMFVRARYKHMDLLVSACLFIQCSRSMSPFRGLSEPSANNLNITIP